jgi:glutaredoxin 3
MRKVKIYSSRDCPNCVMLKRFLQERDIPYVDIDVSFDEEATYELVMKSGQMAVPVTEVEGRVIVGFNVDALTKALELT